MGNAQVKRIDNKGKSAIQYFRERAEELDTHLSEVSATAEVHYDVLCGLGLMLGALGEQHALRDRFQTTVLKAAMALASGLAEMAVGRIRKGNAMFDARFEDEEVGQ